MAQADRAARRKGEPKGKKVATHEQSVNEPEDKMTELSKQVALLQQQLETYTRTKESDRNSQPLRPARRRHPLFCYKCGKDGHRMEKCEGESNPSLVQEKMMARCKPAGNDNGHQ